MRLTLRGAFLGALVTNAGIVVTGGAVRLTASGLGCPTVPKCTDTSMVATREMGVHGAIEFGNRMLTFVLTAAVVAALVTAWRARRRDLVLRAGALLLGILAQALLGAVTVLTGLDPVTVMAHFLLSMVLIAVATEAYARTSTTPATAPAPSSVRTLTGLLTATTAVTLALGTVVTGTGPHSGDKDATDRLPFALETVAQLHADVVFLVLGLAVGTLLAARAVDADRVTRAAVVLLTLLLAQGGVGFVQYATDLPVVLVGAHILGACLVWVATLQVHLAARGRAVVSRGSSAGTSRAPAWAASR